MWTPGLKSDSLVGRRAEQRRVDELIGAAGAGRGAALVLTGEAGIGKTALLEYALREASGLEIVRSAGSEFEQELPFAGLHQLCVPILRHLPELSGRHRAALQVAFGLGDGTPELFHIGLAVLELMAVAAQDRPLLCLVDDVQWVDAASLTVLAFLARRMGADRISMIFAVRTPAVTSELGTVESLAVAGLSDEDARELLARRSPLVLDERVRDSLVAEARGNPLALVELPRAGGFLLPATPSTPTRIEEIFQARLRALPSGARLLLIVASADPTGDPGLLWPAAQKLGLDVTRAAAEAAGSGLAEFDARIRFCHPLARSAVYRAAAVEERRAAHAALAEIVDPVVAPDRRVWHRAQASSGPDDDVAADLERCASRAQARGGVAATAAFLERAVALTMDPALRVERTLASVQATLDAGGADPAADLLTTVDVAALDGYQRARVDVLGGRIAFTRHGDGTGPMLMVSAARRLATLDVQRSRDCFLDGIEMALSVGRARGVIDEVLAAARTDAPPGASPDILDVLIMLGAQGPRGAVPLLAGLPGDDGPWWAPRPALATMIAAEFWDFDTHAAIAGWLEKSGRESGSPALLRLGLGQKACEAVLVGDVGRAITALAEEEAIADAVGDSPLMYPRLLLAAWRGRRTEALALFRSATEAEAGRAGGQVTNLTWTSATLHNGLGNYPAALDAARKVVDDELFHVGGALLELIEAATRCGEPALAARALASLTDHTRAGGTPSALGVAASARALVTGVEDHYREALGHLAESPLKPYRGRAHLLYGEWLRRQGRRRDSVQHLRTAHDLLSTSGAEGFARRAAGELRAAGEKVNRPSEQTPGTLTAQEIAVAGLVAAGATSPEVAVQLFISKRTVDAHLRNIFRKLGVTSRRQLKDQRFTLG
ncbi:helix-turn-helix transcriptional regulator [Winogradskya humida]|uniref:Helix-turn-helix transcriptional regulator n=1 Tax=Winogradskya humida TaxID=113566 RepID=A0ABQ4A2B9_9ACTN|nr:LuxR family transcriptional regulator [Actinoplanes humidus]GIE24487.1 helix-turn-helix transcriptional regulator [Actinoplanes humidus]